MRRRGGGDIDGGGGGGTRFLWVGGSTVANFESWNVSIDVIQLTGMYRFVKTATAHRLDELLSVASTRQAVKVEIDVMVQVVKKPRHHVKHVDFSL